MAAPVTRKPDAEPVQGGPVADRAQADARTEAMSQFIRGLAHELNNPLAAVLGFCELLRTEADPEKRRHYLEVVTLQAERCRRIVENLVMYARRRPPQCEPMCLDEVVDRAMALASGARCEGVEITRKRCAGNVMIDGDPAQIEQLFYNLMNSAEHALKRWTGRRTISVVSELADCRVVVRVSDSGPPVPEEMRSRVFDPFVAARSTSGESGLGLCMVAEIALAHGGSVELEGGDGSEATTFKVSLPVRRRGSPASGPRSSRT